MTNKEFEDMMKLVIDRSCTEKGRMNESLGLELVSCDTSDGVYRTVFAYNSKEIHLNPHGGLHGGIVSALLDTCMGIAAAAVSGHKVVTTDLSVSFLKALKGKRFLIDVEITHPGRHLHSARGKIIDADTNVLCSTGQATFVLLEANVATIQV